MWSKIAPYTPQANFFMFFDKNNLCRVKSLEDNMQKHSNPIFTGVFLGRVKLGRVWGALLCVCKLSPVHQPKSIAQKSTPGLLASPAQHGPEDDDPRGPGLSSVPSVQPSSEHFLHAVNIHEMVPALLAKFLWGKAFYRTCLCKLVPNWNSSNKIRCCIHSL